MMEIVTAQSLSATRGGRLLFQDLNLSLKAGEVAAITGSNGCGKSTLAWSLGLYDLSFQGDVEILGRSVSQLSAVDVRKLHRTRIVLQPQNLLLEDSWTVRDQLKHAARALKIPRRETNAMIRRVLESIRLEHLAHRRIAQLSGGERMRIALARLLLVAEPALVILDEPTAGADAALTSSVVNLMNQWNAAGAAVLIVTHDPALLPHAQQTLRLGSSASDMKD